MWYHITYRDEEGFLRKAAPTIAERYGVEATTVIPGPYISFFGDEDKVKAVREALSEWQVAASGYWFEE